MTSTTPKLTRPEMARLVEIGGYFERFRYHPSCGPSPAVTAKLIAKGLVEPRGGKVAKTGRVVWHPEAILTDAGRAVLAGFPDA